jgi:hypothetical protein
LIKNRPKVTHTISRRPRKQQLLCNLQSGSDSWPDLSSSTGCGGTSILAAQIILKAVAPVGRMLRGEFSGRAKRHTTPLRDVGVSGFDSATGNGKREPL